MDNTTEPNNAAKKPSTLKPSTSFATSNSIKALITKVNSPNVRILIGRVKRIKTGFINMLTSPMTIADHSAAEKPAKLIPGTTHATKSKAKAKSIHLISKKSILFLSLCSIIHFRIQVQNFH